MEGAKPVTKPFQTLREWDAGKPLSAEHLSEAPRAINKMAEHVFPPRQVKPEGVGAQSSAPIEAFKVFDVSGTSLNNANFILCKRMSSVTGGEGYYTGDIIPVARPYLLRAYPYATSQIDRSHVSYSNWQNFYTKRDATVSGPTTITEVITPSYWYGIPTGRDVDLIMAVYMPNGVPNHTGGVLEFYDDPVLWLDLNVDARAWSKEFS